MNLMRNQICVFSFLFISFMLFFVLTGNVLGQNEVLDVTNLNAIVWENSISLSWNNPDINFSEVKIIKSTDHYPDNQKEGEVVYTGTGQNYIDEEIEKDREYYYTIFISDPDNVLSPGARISAEHKKQISEAEVTTMDKFIGTNGFINDPLEKLQVVGSLREYHTWGWDEGNGDNYPGYPDNELKWNLSYVSGDNWGWNFDEYYRELHELGITVIPCTQKSVDWLSGGPEKPPFGEWYYESDLPGIKKAQDARSFIEHGNYIYQFVARYGSNSVPEENLKLADDQPVKSGLGYIDYIENWNEPNLGNPPEFYAPQFAAMTSADYDGHQGELGDHIGAKNADPDIKFVMGGLAGLDIEYIKGMQNWADNNRDGDFPADVLNVHHYSTDGEKGLSPEEDNFKEKAREVNNYRERNLPDKELWITEFGYDTQPGSRQFAGSEKRQAQWLLRSYLELSASGFDRAFMYMLRNVDDESGGVYSTSGLTSSKETGWEPKISWYYVYTLKNRLENMIFDTEINSGVDDILINRYRDIDTYKGAYVLWCSTSEEKVVENYELELMDWVTEARLVSFVDGKTEGAEEKLNIEQNRVEVTVSETPVIVLFE